MTSGKRVLITGIHGFTGRYMAAELREAGYQVFGCGSHASDEPEYFQADLTDAAALRTLLADVRPDMIVHLAALAFVGHGDANAFIKSTCWVRAICLRPLQPVVMPPSVYCWRAALTFMAMFPKAYLAKTHFLRRRMITRSANWPWNTWRGCGYQNCQLSLPDPSITQGSARRSSSCSPRLLPISKGAPSRSSWVTSMFGVTLVTYVLSFVHTAGCSRPNR